MRKHYFTLVGALVGMMCALFGSAILAIVIKLLLYREMILKSGLWEGIWFFFFGVICSIIPGAIGGAHLARWLETSEYKPVAIKRHGLIVGGVAGLAASLVAITIISIVYSESPYVPSVLPLIAMVVFISSLTGQYGTDVLLKRLRKNI